ncbi:MAG TPA: hypothetical protein VGS19_30830 [Streptosporangiaceae bacterium]|nr:hypothetical protein [Streptosporangiaceae bacterium]
MNPSRLSRGTTTLIGAAPNIAQQTSTVTTAALSSVDPTTCVRTAATVSRSVFRMASWATAMATPVAGSLGPYPMRAVCLARRRPRLRCSGVRPGHR